MFGALIRKIFIVMKVLESAQNISTKVQSQRSNQIYSVLTVLLVMLIDAVIIIPWNLLSPSSPSAKSFKVPDIGENYTLLTNFWQMFYTSYPQLLLSSIFKFLGIYWLIHFNFISIFQLFCRWYCDRPISVRLSPDGVLHFDPSRVQGCAHRSRGNHCIQGPIPR